MALHRNIKKSLLFTAHYVNGNLTSVRCNLTGKFVKHSIYLALHVTMLLYSASSINKAVNNVSYDYLSVINTLSLTLLSIVLSSFICLFV